MCIRDSICPLQKIQGPQPLPFGVDQEAMQKALLRERALGYYVPSGRYWQELERFDIEALKSLDQMWLAAVNHRAAAA